MLQTRHKRTPLTDNQPHIRPSSEQQGWICAGWRASETGGEAKFYSSIASHTITAFEGVSGQ
jgi:hypothetical protein